MNVLTYLTFPMWCAFSFLSFPDFLLPLLPSFSSEEFPSLLLWHSVEKLELCGFVCLIYLISKCVSIRAVALLHFDGIVAFFRGAGWPGELV